MNSHPDEEGYLSATSSSRSSVSLNLSMYMYPSEHGRTYNAFRAGSYFEANDQKQQTVGDLLYEALHTTFGGKLFHAPITEPKHVLDIGTGTGVWAFDVGDMLHHVQDAQMIGVDLSPIQPAFVPPNVRFLVDDIEDVWNWDIAFDLIYSRLILPGCIADVGRFFDQAFRFCKPGGFFKLHDLQMPLESDQAETEIPADDPIRKWCDQMCLGIRYFDQGGRRFDIGLAEVVEKLTAAGFINIVGREIKFPLGAWHDEEELKTAGEKHLVAMVEGIEGQSLAIFTRTLGWSLPEVQALMAQVRAQLRRKFNSGRYYRPGYLVYAQKPAHNPS